MTYKTHFILNQMKRAKYGNRTTVVDQIKFDSIAEARRYSELRLLERAGEIKNLALQPEFILQIGFVDNMGERQRAIKYIADFAYYDNKLKSKVVEDVKGMKNPVYKLKKKMLLYAYQDFIFRELQ